MTALQLAGVPLSERLRLYKFFKHMPLVSAKPPKVRLRPPYTAKQEAAPLTIYHATRADWPKE